MTAEEFVEEYPDAEFNENCLQDIACPECGNRRTFRIDATITATVRDGGTDNDESDTEWDENSHCVCGDESCGEAGILKNFTIEGLDDLIYEKKAEKRLAAKEARRAAKESK